MASCVSWFFTIISLSLIPRACKKKYATPTLSEVINTTANKIISQTPEFKPTQEQLKKAKSEPCHQILNGLFLGNSRAFVETTHVDFTDVPDGSTVSKKRSTNNELNMNTVITVCPWQAIAGQHDGLSKIRNEVEKGYEDNQINWLHVGQAITDGQESWLPLVHNCTFPTTDLAQQDIPTNGEEPGVFDERANKRKANIEKVAVKALFEPIFTEIDLAILKKKRVLVHCQAGVSRSSSVIAAYMINRFGVTAEQAVNYLKSRRFQVDSKFMKGLKQYENSLKQ